MVEDLKGLELGGFLGEYVRYAATVTDAPEEYHVFCGLAALSAAAGSVRVPYGGASYPPALWLVLVGSSGFYRKSTSMELARRVLARARSEAAPAAVYDPSRLLASMRHQGKLLFVDDFTWLLASPVCERLIELGDCGSALSLVSATSAAALSCCLSAGQLASGFPARFGFVVPDEKRTWLGMPGEGNAAAERRLARLLRRTARLHGKASFAQCQAGLREWVEQTAAWANGMARRPGHMAAACGVASRLQLTAMKIAALVEVSRAVAGEELTTEAQRAQRSETEVAGGMWPLVSPESFAAARRLAGFLRLSFGRLLTQKLREANEFTDELRLMTMVRNRPGTTRRRLQQNSHMDADTFGRTLVVLERNGRVRRNGKGYFPAENGGETALLAEPPANTHVAEPAAVST